MVWFKKIVEVSADACAGSAIAAAATAIAASTCRLIPAGKIPARRGGRVSNRRRRDARQLPDHKPAPEHPLERLAVAVALNAPARQDQIAGVIRTGRVQMQVDAVTVGA